MNKVNKELLDTLIMWVNAFEDGDNGYKEYENCLKTSLSAISKAQEAEKFISVEVPLVDQEGDFFGEWNEVKISVEQAKTVINAAIRWLHFSNDDELSDSLEEAKLEAQEGITTYPSS